MKDLKRLLGYLLFPLIVINVIIGCIVFGLSIPLHLMKFECADDLITPFLYINDKWFSLFE